MPCYWPNSRFCTRCCSLGAGRGLGPPGATWAGGRLATTTYALIASVQVWLLFALWSPSGTVGGGRAALCSACCAASMLGLGCCCSSRSSTPASRCRSVCWDGGPWRAIGSPIYPTDADHGSVSPVPAADLRRLRADALDGADDHAGPTRHLLGADRLLPGRSLVQGGAVRAAIRRAIRPLPAKCTLLAAVAAAARRCPVRCQWSGGSQDHSHFR
jgi:hypothetical protein